MGDKKIAESIAIMSYINEKAKNKKDNTNNTNNNIDENSNNNNTNNSSTSNNEFVWNYSPEFFMIYGCI